MRISTQQDSESEKISIIVLTYNRKRLLKDCLNSLLSQSYAREKLEIVVVDDGSVDGTREVVIQLMSRHRHLKYVYQNHRGIPAARNNGIRNVTGDIIAIVADDYILQPTYAETVITFFRQTPGAMVIRFKIVASRSDLGSRISHFFYDMSVRRQLLQASIPTSQSWKDHVKRLLQRMPPLEEKITTRHELEAAGAAAFRREVFMRVGLFDESLQRAEDSDLTRRLRWLGIFVYYIPHHDVKHQYSPFLLDTLYKCFLSGFYRYKYYKKHSILGNDGVIKTIVFMKIAFVLNAFWRARQVESVGRFFFYLPFMFLFEAVNKFGFLLSWLLSKTATK